MVKLLFMLLVPVLLFSQDAQITAEINNGEGYANQPLEGTLSITHHESRSVEENSFTIEDKPLAATPIKTVIISSSAQLIISLYSFTLPPRKIGLHVLPPIYVTVGGKQVHSTASTYEVREKPPASKMPQAILELKNFTRVPDPFYAGQRALLGYEISFKTNLSLTEENLPLLKAKGLKTIGQLQAENLTSDGKNVQKITQLVEAVRPGHLTYGPSSIQGEAYIIDNSGNKIYEGSLLFAQAPQITIIVTPFPKENRPASFDGAVGNFHFAVKLISPSEVSVEDTLKLSLAISGEGEFDTVTMPDLLCQPGWSGLLATRDLPPAVKMERGTKTFIQEVRPLTAHLKAIPKIAFSFFDPSKREYITQESEPIPIKVHPLKEEKRQKLVKVPQYHPPANEISNVYPLSSQDLKNRPFGTWRALWILPVALLLFLLQFYLRKKWIAQKKKLRIVTSQKLLDQALSSPPGSSLFYHNLNRAFYLLLIEKGIIKDGEELPKEGPAKEVRLFLEKVDQMHFSGDKKDNFNALAQEAKALYQKLKT